MRGNGNEEVVALNSWAVSGLRIPLNQIASLAR
jgi:hypothetical protein